MFLAMSSFVAGITSFFSPCVVGVLPLYLAYLSGATASTQPETASVVRRRLILNTLCFVAGIGLTFIGLALAASGASQVIEPYRDTLSRLGGVLVLLLGLYQLGVFGASRVLSTEHRLPFAVNKLSMNPAVAFLLGLVFSFSWTPCVGPVMAGLIIIAANTDSQLFGMGLIALYTLGLSLPFVVISVVADAACAFLRKNAKVLTYISKAGGVILVLIGLIMVAGLMGNFSAPGTDVSADTPARVQHDTPKPQVGIKKGQEALDFSLQDAEGTSYTLSDFRGKRVVVNFWAEWCGYCVQEIPEFQRFYTLSGSNEEDTIVLSIVSPTPNGDKSPDQLGVELTDFLRRKGGEYPALIDPDGSVFKSYQVRSLPTTLIINEEGVIEDSILGATTAEQLFVKLS